MNDALVLSRMLLVAIPALLIGIVAVAVALWANRREDQHLPPAE